MELCYLYLGLSLLTKNLGLNYPTMVLVLLLYIVPAFSGRIAESNKRVEAFAGSAAVVLGVSACAFAARQALIGSYPGGGVAAVVAFCGLAFWLGYSIAHADRSHHQVIFRFQIGILFFVIFSGAGNLFPVVAFAILALFALSRARWESALSAGGRVLKAIPLWWLLLGSLAVIVPAFGAIFVISPDVARSVFHSMGSGYSGFVGWFADLAGSDFWHKQLIDWRPSCFFPSQTRTSSAAPLPPTGTATIPPIVTVIVGLAVLLIVLASATFAVMRMRRKTKSRPAAKAAFETLAGRVDLFKGLVAFLRSMVKWLRQVMLFFCKRARITGYSQSPDEAITSMSTLYRNLLRWAAEHAVPRQESQTATEYLRVLCRCFPQEKNDLALITDTYIHARYGRDPTTHGQFDMARQAWQKAKLAMKLRAA